MQSQVLSKCERLFTVLVSLFFLSALLGGCAGKEVNREDPDALFQGAEEAFKDEHYLVALEKYRDIKNRFPYSARAVDSELRIADTYFEQESYIEAESAYEIFKELHPTHSKGDYVQYRIGLSFFKQIPDDSARDLSAAYKAIEAFGVLEQKYSSSEYLSKAREHIVEARKRLAEHENYVANFYYQRQHYLSASYRYSALLQEYGNLGYDEEALYRLVQSYYHIKMYENAEDAARRLMSQFPATKYKDDVKTVLEAMKKKG
ncbi:MAG: outer membrane protein assembly factor BamD [Proteobacteria bacterium]|nr:outer membrane protein assembly factor BamD [Pseudomonadota bacterium]NDC24935.1 outer membrane protein assembly factor BamD [Pseudomonadota bacterium]NDD04810.1 outer membrane protein assembly factor BamD [Pseudomonadota bacterium]NDG27678.1 outer membrane protein assembly factor BamD [Pseudomonadota bacterium]